MKKFAPTKKLQKRDREELNEDTGHPWDDGATDDDEIEVPRRRATRGAITQKTTGVAKPQSQAARPTEGERPRREYAPRTSRTSRKNEEYALAASVDGTAKFAANPSTTFADESEFINQAPRPRSDSRYAQDRQGQHRLVRRGQATSQALQNRPVEVDGDMAEHGLPRPASRLDRNQRTVTDVREVGQHLQWWEAESEFDREELLKQEIVRVREKMNQQANRNSGRPQNRDMDLRAQNYDASLEESDSRNSNFQSRQSNQRNLKFSPTNALEEYGNYESGNSRVEVNNFDPSETVDDLSDYQVRTSPRRDVSSVRTDALSVRANVPSVRTDVHSGSGDSFSVSEDSFSGSGDSFSGSGDPFSGSGDRYAGRGNTYSASAPQFENDIFIESQGKEHNLEVNSHSEPVSVNFVGEDLDFVTFDFGELGPYMNDPKIEEIWINGPDKVFVASNGRSQQLSIQIPESEIREMVERLLMWGGRRLDLSNPFVDARLPDGSRLHVAIPEITPRFWAVNIRKHTSRGRNLDDLAALGTMSSEVSEFLTLAVQANLNIMVSGSTQAGKTTLLNALVGEVPARTRVITIEEVFELNPIVKDWVALQTRSANLQGEGEIPLRRLIKESLRMRPDRIIVGEIREAESLDLLIALNSGLPGMGTIHANSAVDALAKLQTLPLLAGENISHTFITPLIASCIDLVVHASIERVEVAGQLKAIRRVEQVLNVTGRVESGHIECEPVFRIKNGRYEKGLVDINALLGRRN